MATADRRIKDIATEIRLTSFVIEELGNVFKSDETKTLISKGALKTADETMKECSDVFAEIDATLKKSKKNTFGRLMLPFRDTKIELLRSHIDKLKDTLTLLLGVLSVAHHVATKKLDRKAKAEAKAQIQELIELKKKSAKKYAESLKNFSISDGSSQTLLDDADAENVDATVQIKAANDEPAPLSVMAIASSINPQTLETCVQHVRSLLDSIETLQQALTNAVDGSDHSTHHQSLIDSYFRARGHLDGVIFRGSPQQDIVTDAQSDVELTKQPALSSRRASTRDGARVKPQVVIDFDTIKPYNQKFDGTDAESPTSDATHTIRTGSPEVTSLSFKRFTLNPQPSSTIQNFSSEGAPDGLEIESLESLFEHNSAASEDASTDDISHDGLISGMGSWNHKTRHSGPQDMSSMTPLRLGPQYERRRGLSSSRLMPSIADTHPNTPNSFRAPTATDLHDQTSGKDVAAKTSETNTPYPAHGSPITELHSYSVVSDGRHGRDNSSESSSGTNPSRSSRILVTSGTENEARLRVDETAPLSLQFNGDMEGRSLQLVPAESGMTDMVVGGNGSRSRRATYRSERDSATSKSRSVIADHKRREAEDVSERSKNANSTSSVMSLISSVGSRNPRLRRSKRIVGSPSGTMSQRSDPNPYFSRTSAQGPAVVQTARTRRQVSAARPRPQSFAGDPSTFWAPGMPAPYPSPAQYGPPPEFSYYQNANSQHTSYCYPNYYAQQRQPLSAQQGPISAYPSTSRRQREYSAPAITQEGQPQYLKRYRQVSVPNTRPSSSQMLAGQYGQQDSEEFSESEYSEDEADEHEVLQQQKRTARALMPPPELRRNQSQRSPALIRATTTQVVEDLEANRPERRQSIMAPVIEAVSRERRRDRERVPTWSAAASKRPSVSRPTPRRPESRSTQSETESRLATIQLGDSGYDQRTSYERDRNRAARDEYYARKQRKKGTSGIIIQERYMPSLPDNDDGSEAGGGEEDDAWSIINPQDNVDLMNRVKEDEKRRKAKLIAEEHMNASRGSDESHADAINKSKRVESVVKNSSSDDTGKDAPAFLPNMASQKHQAQVEDYQSDDDSGQVMAEKFPRRPSPTAQANVRCKRSKDLTVERKPVQHHSKESNPRQSQNSLSRTASMSSKPQRPAHPRSWTITRERRDTEEVECRDPNCTDCGPYTRPPRRQNIAGYPSETMSQRSDPNPYYSTPPVYNGEPALYASHGLAVVETSRQKHRVKRAKIPASPKAIKTELQAPLSDFHELPNMPTSVVEDIDPKEHEGDAQNTTNASPQDQESGRDQEHKDSDVLETLAEQTGASSKTQTQSQAGRKAMKRTLPYITGMRSAGGRPTACSVDANEGSEDETIFSMAHEARRKAPALQSDALEGVARSESGDNFDEVDKLLKEWTTVY